MNPIARELNDVIENANPNVMQMLSQMGRKLFFPKGILSQSAEAKEKAHRMNATIGIATEKKQTMYLKTVMDAINDIPPHECLTYAPSFGIPALRQRWRDEMLQKNPSLANQSISLPVVTCGITHALSIFADVWIDPGDIVILPDMMWGNYNMIFALRKGARIHHYPLFTETLRFNTAAFARAVEQTAAEKRKIIVLLNFPHNPTGYAVSRSEGEAVAQILLQAARQGTQVVVAFDDSYFGLFYESDTLKESLFAHVCGQDPRLLAVKLDGATKEHYVWGLRVGFITYATHADTDNAALYTALEKKTAGCIRGNISNASHLGQSILLKSMQHPDFDQQKKAKFDIMQKRAREVKAALANPAYDDVWEAYPFNSGYFMCLRLKTVDAEALRKHLLDAYGVGLIAIDNRNLRIAFSCLEKQEIPLLFDTVLKGIQDLT